MQTISRSTFTTVKTEGGLLPADLLQRIVDGADLDGLRPEDYHLLPTERLNEAINRAWNRCLGAWTAFDEQRQNLAASNTGTTLTRERWLLILFTELGYGRLPSGRSVQINGDSYPISHMWERTPFHLVTFRQDLDRRSEVSTAVRRSPHSLMQEFLNRSDEHQWGIISNGLRLRILRDNASLSRAAYVEFDLEAMMSGELYAEFSLLWLVCHQSRVENLGEIGSREIGSREGQPTAYSPLPTASSDCWLERWSQQAADQGARALDSLRDGVQEAIEALGHGVLAHRDNKALRERLRSGKLTTQDLYQQLRRQVYRFIFLFVAEDRDLLLLPGAADAVRKLYEEHYSLHRLRELAANVRGGPHPDRYRQVRLLFSMLREGYAPLGLPGLGSFLFSSGATPDLDDAEIANHDLLDAVRALAFTVENSVRRPVDYRNLDSEELGSVYESLLELHPQMNLDAATFKLKTAAGSERKTTGSYYTPTPLVNELLNSALEPVVADRLEKARRQARQRSGGETGSLQAALEQAILSIKVLDYATGSGHMLIGAARRLARHLASIRSGDEEPSPDAIRHALRDVVRHCIYGVDMNDTAVELCKVALWMESLEPGKPLSFLDKNIQCGNSLIGVTPGLDIEEIPDDAFRPKTGDDRATATALRRRNKREREGQLGMRFDVTIIETPEDLARWRARQVQQVAAIAEDDVAQLAVKEQAYARYLQSDEYGRGRLAYDLWTAAFFWRIPAGDAEAMPAPTQQALVELRAGHTPDAELVRRVQETARRHQFFHWELAFPDVFEREQAGFDVVLSNPPWERIKLQEKEWFAARSPEIANAPNAAARRRMIEALQKEDPALHKAFLTDRRAAECESHFIRNSSKYPLCGRGDVNTYAVFAELARQVLSPVGRAGVIVPTGIATDDTTKYFFQEIMETRSLASLYDFENRRAIFPGVHRSYKFCLLTLRGAVDREVGSGEVGSRGSVSQRSPAAEFVFFALDVADLRLPEKRFTLTAEEIALLNPNTRTCPIFRSQRDAELTKGIYRRVPVLIKEGGGPLGAEENPWGVTFRQGLFNMTSDSHLFRTREQLEAEGWRLEGNRFVRGGEVFLPLYEAKMFHHFDHRWATYDGLDTRDVTLPEKTDSGFTVLPRHWVYEADVRTATGDYTPRWFIAFRNVARATDERTGLFSL
ncbi:MAG: hypothetical protein QM346_02730, partial [Chloroflexota bacterium]|nr:hypothetical protein [Chloroflexota bacterium]